MPLPRHRGDEEAVPTTPTRLQIATRMHELLLREIGHGIEVERLLTRDRYARDVLLVCDACTGSDLARLAAEFRLLTPGAARPAPTASPGHATHPTDWSRDTSGFGGSHPPEVRPANLPPAPTDSGRRSRLPWR